MHASRAQTLWTVGLLAVLHLALTSADPGAAAPLRVGLVRWHELPRHQGGGPATLQQRSAASALRAAGYPAVFQLSKPPFQRSEDAVSGKRGVPAISMATPIPLGVRSPTVELTSKGTQSARMLQQQQPSSIESLGGFKGTASTAPAGTTGLAAGPHHLMHAAGGLVTIYNLSATATSSGVHVLQQTQQSVPLSALMSAVSAGCDGVYDPSAVFDTAANRFVLSATCGGQGLVLLAVSASSDAAGAWFVAALVADGVGTSLACSSPILEAALVDYTQLTYNADGVFVTYKSICPSNATNNGVGLLAVPKWALYRGAASYKYPIYTGAELSAALQGGQGSSSSSSSCAQLVPAVPQEVTDLGAAHFVCELVSQSTSKHSAGRQAAVFALVDTASLWQYGGPATNTSAPLLAGQVVALDAPSPPVTGVPLRQPQGAQPLQLGNRPRGLWNGAAVLSGGQLYLAASTFVSDRASPSYSRRPAVTWAQVSVTAATQGTDTCPQSRVGVASRQAWDWAKDYSRAWGSQVAPTPDAAASQAAASNSSDRAVHAAGLLPILGAAQFAAVGLSQLGANPCTCYSCFWGGQYNRYSGYNGGALAGSGSGFAAGGYFFNQGTMSRCQSFCTRCWYYGYPGHGFGNVGDDRTFMDLQAAAPFAANISGASPVDGPTLSINTAAQAEAASLFAACTRSGSLQAQVVRQGVVTQGGEQPLGLVFPAMAVGRGGELLLAFSYSGPGGVGTAAPAYLGVGAVVVPPGSNSSSSVAVLQPGRGTIKPAALAAGGVPPSGGWAELSAAAVQSGSGGLFTVSHFASAAAADSSSVGSWLNSWRL